MSKPKPSKRQLEFLDWEFGAFFHFGIRSYYKGYTDWDERDMDASVFNPTELDCKKWLEVFQRTGATYAILVAKHHDGFANWPTKYSDYSVANTPWKNGKGDLVREFTDACRELGMKVGIYYSPAQRDWSKFSSDKEYDDYFIGQVGELLQNYGKIDYLWFDGCGSEGHEYDQPRIIHAMRSMQPELLIFNMWDPDVRWIGNERGIAPAPYTNVVKELSFSVMTDRKDALDGMRFLPAECDTNLRDTWFDCEDNDDTVYTLDELMGIYYQSVGRGANLLLNVGPHRSGKLLKLDEERILEFGQELHRRFDHPLTAFSEWTSEGDCLLSRTGREKYTDGELVNHLVIMEDLTEGESIRHFEIYSELSKIYEGETVGHKAICSFPTVRTNSLKIRITDSDGDYRIRSVKAYYVQ